MTVESDLSLKPGDVIGILGGGQLGRMLAIAAAQLGLKTTTFTPDANAPATDVSKFQIIADYNDQKALKRFADHINVATYEFENIPLETLYSLETFGTSVFPNIEALKITQDRLLEKTFLTEHSIPVAPFFSIGTLDDLEKAAVTSGMPAILKTRRFGYDGKGQVRLERNSVLETAFDAIAQQEAVLEAFIGFEKEISVVAARGRDGSFQHYDLSENIHHNQILYQSFVPTDIPAPISELAYDITRKIADALNFIGVFAVEFFYCGMTSEQPLIVNEIAPRVHNTGHWTLEACCVNQFENHIRAVAGWPIGQTHRHSDAVMTNLLGADVMKWSGLLSDQTVKLHLYGKSDVKADRKMGHFTKILEKTGR
ncbi:MAG: 5-(carboxyamino)imidazole ribonucleotide synthase [Pseudomonadota bacterium]